jgi:hypothetical protein
MTKDGLNGIVRWLERVNSRVGMYIGPTDNVPVAQAFLQGYRMACDAVGYSYTLDAYQTEVESRGWERQATGLVPQMRARGASDDRIVRELFEVEIQTWKRLLEVLPDEDISGGARSAS